ncbi:hypothetical protein WN944_014225 [Citrus x changshan-huyou]|uniref:DJ-1/PfpI domain-containing protein n=1 Tax=Citrus x changshan-huyou TaxID=2935761 RepID=A0AAP0QIJ4_9ROSI
MAIDKLIFQIRECEILVPIANGSKKMEVVIIIDILRRAKANVVVASVEDKLEIMASRQVKLVADMLIDEAAKLSYDLIVLPGGLGGAQAFAKSEKLVNMLKKQKESNRPYGARCASPALVLKPHGLLKDKKATTSYRIKVKSKTGLWLMATLSPAESQELPWNLHWQLWRSFLAATKRLSLQRYCFSPAPKICTRT